jgi:hypothetical protein
MLFEGASASGWRILEAHKGSAKKAQWKYLAPSGMTYTSKGQVARHIQETMATPEATLEGPRRITASEPSRPRWDPVERRDQGSTEEGSGATLMRSTGADGDTVSAGSMIPVKAGRMAASSPPPRTASGRPAIRTTKDESTPVVIASLHVDAAIPCSNPLREWDPSR